MDGTSVTAILIGAQTSQREYVGYEIKQSVKEGKGVLAVYIHRLEDRNGNTDSKGNNPLDDWTVERNGREVRLSEIYRTYDWVNDDGYKNFGDWVERAARDASK